jgi:hypothetical protein
LISRVERAMDVPDPVARYRRATERAVAAGVRADQLELPTPCSAWPVQDLLDHLVGGTRYLRAALLGGELSAPAGTVGGRPPSRGAGLPGGAGRAGRAPPDVRVAARVRLDGAGSDSRDLHGRAHPHLGPGDGDRADRRPRPAARRRVRRHVPPASTARDARRAARASDTLGSCPVHVRTSLTARTASECVRQLCGSPSRRFSEARLSTSSTATAHLGGLIDQDGDAVGPDCLRVRQP